MSGQAEGMCVFVCAKRGAMQAEAEAEGAGGWARGLEMVQVCACQGAVHAEHEGAGGMWWPHGGQPLLGPSVWTGGACVGWRGRLRSTGWGWCWGAPARECEGCDWRMADSAAPVWVRGEGGWRRWRQCSGEECRALAAWV